MIAGVKLSMTSDELKQTLLKRIDFHVSKAGWLEKKIAELGPELGELDNEAEGQGKYRSGNAAMTSFREKMNHHKNKATVFRFMAEHVIPNETYVLDENDLRRLEVIGDVW